MANLCKKTTVLFDPQEFEEIKQVAKRLGCSVGELIRRTVRERYLLSTPEERLQAVEALGRMSLPVGTWQEIEDETRKGALE